MASPGIKLSELTKYEKNGKIGNISGFVLSEQKLLLAYQQNNYQVPLSVLSSKFVDRDFPKSENHLSSSWNFTDCEVLANDPVDTVDVANGNTLSALQNIFDRFPGIWPLIFPPFINKYTPNVKIVNKGKKWVQRDSGGSLQNMGKRGNIYFYSIPWPVEGGINDIGPEGGYWFPDQKIYMNFDDELDYDMLERLGWTDDMTSMTIKRYRIDPNSRIGAAFNASYIVEHGSDTAKGRGAYIAWNDHMTVTVNYGKASDRERIAYMGGKRYAQPDSSPYLNNEWWGEGKASNPEIKGADWYYCRSDETERDKLLVNGSGSESLHGARLNLYHYSVEVTVEEITVTEQ